MIIHIEYCVKWNYGPEFDRVSNEIKLVDNSIEVIGNLKPPRSGAFEIAVDNEIVFSKFNSRRFPDNKEIRDWIK